MNNIATITQNKGGFLMEPQNLQEAMQLADMLANSNLVPKSYQGKAGDVLVACQWGSEIGLKPLQALQNIAVINNVPAVWGDALVALVRGSGLCEYIKQDWDAATKTAICSVKRRGEPEETRTFSEEDARLAGHLNKDTYKKNLQRMLSIRARALRCAMCLPTCSRVSRWRKRWRITRKRKISHRHRQESSRKSLLVAPARYSTKSNQLVKAQLFSKPR